MCSMACCNLQVERKEMENCIYINLTDVRQKSELQQLYLHGSYRHY